MALRPGLSFSHMGFYVHDIGRMEGFYTELLDFAVTDRGTLPAPGGGSVSLVFLSRDPDEHHQIVLASGRPGDLAFNVINQISLRADSLATLKAYHRRFWAAKVDDIAPVTHGNAVSFYARDPEGNRLEIFWDTPWYVSQPMRETIDIERPDEEILQELERRVRSMPGYRSRADWRREMVELMDRKIGDTPSPRA